MLNPVKIKDPDVLFFKGAITGNNAENFVFDVDKLKKCVNAIASNETSCIIYGDRGIGKTSFAWQVLSILQNSNTKYSKNDLLVIGKNKKFKSIFFKCNRQIADIYELLLNIMRPSPDPFSLSKVFPDLYEDKKFKAKFKAKFKFDLYKLVNVEIGFDDATLKSKVSDEDTYTILSSKQTIQNLFETIISEIKDSFEDTEIVFFVDEIDELQDKNGLGSFLKNLNGCKFVFIGIALSITEIILDHQSAGRKLIGGDIEIDNLSDDQIKWIFKNAEIRSNGGVFFSDDFINHAARYSGGFPWIAQNCGFNSIISKLYKGVNENDSIYLDANDYEPALKECIKLYQKEIETNLDLDFATDSSVNIKTLEYIWNSKNAPTEEEIRNQVGALAKFLSPSLLRLQESGVIIKTVHGTYKFLNPSVRILMRYQLDSLLKE